MSKYTLTTDLIADCMALIPDNLERLNNEKYKIEIDKNSFTINGWSPFFYITDNSTQGFLFISHCLRTIPEFQAENPKIKRLINEIQEAKIKEKESIGMGECLYHSLIQINKKRLKEIKFKTISSATLHGQGEFPPATLEELVESYKNVMKK